MAGRGYNGSGQSNSSVDGQGYRKTATQPAEPNSFDHGATHYAPGSKFPFIAFDQPVTLTGYAAPATFGALIAGPDAVLTGYAAPFTAGSIIVGSPVVLTGYAAPSAFGALIAGPDAVLTGYAAPFTAGALIAGPDAVLTGYVAPAAFGALIAGPDAVLTGYAAPATFDTLVVGSPVVLTGYDAPTAFDTLIVGSPVVLTGYAAPATFDTLVVGSPVVLTGYDAPFTAGTLIVGQDAVLTGYAAPFTAGTLIVGSPVVLTGYAAPFVSGIVGVSTVLTLTGFVAPTAFGSLAASQHATPAITSHCDLAKARLLEQFINKRNIERLVCIIGDLAQEVEQTTADVLTYRSIDTASSASLTNIVKNIGMPRHGVGDAEFRQRADAMVQLIVSHAHPDAVLEALVTLDAGTDPSSISITDYLPIGAIATATVPVGAIIRGEFWAWLIKQMSPAGVKLILEYYETGVDILAWEMTADDDGIGGDLSEDGSDGGNMAEAV